MFQKLDGIDWLHVVLTAAVMFLSVAGVHIDVVPGSPAAKVLAPMVHQAPAPAPTPTVMAESTGAIDLGGILQTAIGAVLGILGVEAVNVTINQPNTLNVYNPQHVNVYKTPVPLVTATPGATATATP